MHVLHHVYPCKTNFQYPENNEHNALASFCTDIERDSSSNIFGFHDAIVLDQRFPIRFHGRTPETDIALFVLNDKDLRNWWKLFTALDSRTARIAVFDQDNRIITTCKLKLLVISDGTTKRNYLSCGLSELWIELGNNFYIFIRIDDRLICDFFQFCLVYDSTLPVLKIWWEWRTSPKRKKPKHVSPRR